MRLTELIHPHSLIACAAETGAGNAGPASEAGVADANDDDDSVSSDFNLTLEQLGEAAQSIDPSVVVTNFNFDKADSNGQYAIIPIVTGRSKADRAIAKIAIVQYPTFDEMISRNPDFFKIIFEDIIENRVKKGVQAFAAGRVASYDLPSMAMLMTWNEVPKRRNRIVPDESWSKEIAPSVIAAVKQKANFEFSIRDLRDCFSSAFIASTKFPNLSQEMWKMLINLAINVARNAGKPYGYLESWLESRDAPPKQNVVSFDLTELQF